MFKTFTKLTLSLAILGAMTIPAFAGKPSFGGFGGFSGGNRGGQSGQSSFRGNMGNMMGGNKFQAAQRQSNIGSNISKNVGKFNSNGNNFNQGIKNRINPTGNTGIAGNLKNKIQQSNPINNGIKNSGIVNKNIGNKIGNIAKNNGNKNIGLNSITNKIGKNNGFNNFAKKIDPGFSKGNHFHDHHDNHCHTNFWWNSYCNHHHCNSGWDPCYTSYVPVCTPCDVVVTYPVCVPVQVPVEVPVVQQVAFDPNGQQVLLDPMGQPIVQASGEEPIVQPAAPPMGDAPQVEPIATPPAAVAAADLSVEDIKVLEVGDPAKNLGPLFRITMKNNGSAPAEKFGLGVFASLNDKPGDNMVSGGVEIEGLAGGEVKEFDVRMPLDALNIKADAKAANGEVFKFIFAVADPANTVQESEKKNNIKGMARDAIQKLDVAAAK